MNIDTPRKKILYIHNDDFLLQIYEKKIRKHDFDFVPIKSDTEDLLACIKLEHPDLVMMDLILWGSDGFALAQKIKQDPLTRNISVLALTNLSRPEDIARGKECGIDEYVISSNHTFDEVIQKMAKLLGVNILSSPKTLEVHNSFKFVIKKNMNSFLEKVKDAIPTIVVVAFILVGGCYLFFANKKVDENVTDVWKGDAVMQELTDRYQATEWADNLDYTIEMQEQLNVGKPIIFHGYVDDIFQRDDKMILRVSSYFTHFELECSPGIVDAILQENEKDDSYFNNEYAVVANIQKVFKPTLSLQGSTLSEDEVEIQYESADMFVAKGSCVDVKQIPE